VPSVSVWYYVGTLFSVGKWVTDLKYIDLTSGKTMKISWTGERNKQKPLHLTTRCHKNKHNLQSFYQPPFQKMLTYIHAKISFFQLKWRSYGTNLMSSSSDMLMCSMDQMISLSLEPKVWTFFFMKIKLGSNKRKGHLKGREGTCESFVWSQLIMWSPLWLWAHMRNYRNIFISISTLILHYVL
jgi:hypothetical protein